MMLEINFECFPILETSRLILRRLTLDDANEVLELRSNPEIMKYIPRPLAKNIEDAETHIKLIDSRIVSNEAINWVISLKNNPKFIGIIGFHVIKPEHFRAEIGYILLPQYHNKGIITEAINCAIAYGFNQLGLHSIEAIIDPRNMASEKVLQKNNFKKEAHLLENEFYNGEFLDTVIYSLLKNNFNK